MYDFKLSDNDFNSGNSYNHFNNYNDFKEPLHQTSPTIQLTKRKLTFIILLVLIISLVASFGGMYAYSYFFPNGFNTSSGSVTTTGYTLAKATGSEKTVKEVVNENKNAVVEIKTESVQSSMWMRQYVTEGAGSGVVIRKDGYIVTNRHVIDGATKITVTLASNEKEYTATLVGTSSDLDIAVLKIDAKNLAVATYGNSDDLQVGDMSVVIGNPLGALGGTVTTGIVSALDRQISINGQSMSLLQTDASVNPGNSGGGMFDQYGHLIGIVVAKSSGSDVEGLGFAIPIAKAAPEIQKILENK